MSSRFVQALEPRRLLSTYYVSPSGKDGANGLSPTHPWRTIDRANRADLQPGDKVLFEGGNTFAVRGTPGENVIVNPSFESSFDGWSDTMGTAEGNSLITTASHTGTGALVITGSGAGARGQDVTASIKRGQAYKMAVWTKVDAPGNGIRRIGVRFSQAGQTVATFYRGFRNTDWAETDWAFVAPPQFDTATVFITRTGDGSALYADDLVLHSLPNGIVLDDSDSGTARQPVIIASYGTGKATIAAGDGIGLWGGNVQGVRVQNLKFTGTWDSISGSGDNVGAGIDFVNTRSDNSKLEFVTVEKCETSGFQWAGIRVGGWAAKSGFRLVLITDSIARGNGDIGILVRGEFDKSSNLYANEKVFIARCKAYSNSGIPDRASNSGSGILISDTNMGTVERSIAHHNGVLNSSPSGGPIGIWAFDASKINLQYNESYSNQTGTTRDGAGFDLDAGVTQSIVQNNYSHDNDGAGYLLGQFSNSRSWGRNILRNNISQNDSRKQSYGAITLSGPPGPYKVVIEHNTVYMTPSALGASTSAMRLKYCGTGVSISNNIFMTTLGVPVVNADASAALAQFSGNDYWNATGLKIRWSGTTYNTLEAWRAATGREMSDSIPTGLNVDPQLNSPGTAGTLGNALKLNTLTQYRLQSTSPLIDQSVAIPSAYNGYAPAKYDFFGRDVSKSIRDVGAAEFV